MDPSPEFAPAAYVVQAESPSYQLPASVNGDQRILDRGPQQEYRDRFWIMLFVIAAIVYVVIAIIGQASQKHGGVDHVIDSDLVNLLWVALTASMGSAFAWILIWLAIIRFFPGSLIRVLFAIAVVLPIILIAIGSDVNLFSLIMWELLVGVYWWICRKRIPMASVMLTMASKCVTRFPGSIGVALSAAILVGLLFLFGFRVASLSKTAIILLIISGVYLSQVAQLIVHVTVSGVAASCFFFAEPRNVVIPSLKRSCTTSFGTICMASIVIRLFVLFAAVVMLIPFVGRCLGRTLREMLAIFQTYAMSYVAIYGRPFTDSARATYDLMKSSGIDSIVNDSMANGILNIGVLIGTILSFAMSFVVSFAFREAISAPQPRLEHTIVVVLISALVAMLLLMIVFQPIRSVVATLFVCWSEDPQSIRTSQPDQYDKLIEATRKRFPETPLRV